VSSVKNSPAGMAAASLIRYSSILQIDVRIIVHNFLIQSVCPYYPPCPTAFDYRCVDMSCRQNCSDVPPKNVVFDEYDFQTITFTYSMTNPDVIDLL
jgi:hypothetical protein